MLVYIHKSQSLYVEPRYNTKKKRKANLCVCLRETETERKRETERPSKDFISFSTKSSMYYPKISLTSFGDLSQLTKI